MLAEESERSGGGEVLEEGEEASAEGEGGRTSGVALEGGMKAGSGAKSGETSGLARAGRQ